MRKVDRTKKRIKILEGALLVFAEKGYHNTKMADVANKVGIGKATIYEYFRNKKELFFSLAELLEKRFLEHIENMVNSTDDAVTKLKCVINSLVEIGVKWEDALRVLFMFWTEHVRKGEVYPLESRLREFYCRLMKLIESIYREGVKSNKFKSTLPPEEFARSVVAAIDGLAFQWILSGKNFDLTDMGKKYLEFLMSSIVIEPVSEDG